MNYSKNDVKDMIYNIFETYDLPNSPKFGERFESWLNDKWLNGNNWANDNRLGDFHEAEVESFICGWLSKNPMENLITRIESNIHKLRNWIDKVVRDELEFDLNDFNICISGYEYDYDQKCIDLDRKINAEYELQVNVMTIDAKLTKHLKSMFAYEQQALNHSKSVLKRWKNLNKWYLKTAKHIESNQIQANVDAKRTQSFT